MKKKKSEEEKGRRGCIQSERLPIDYLGTLFTNAMMCSAISLSEGGAKEQDEKSVRIGVRVFKKMSERASERKIEKERGGRERGSILHASTQRSLSLMSDCERHMGHVS